MFDEMPSYYDDDRRDDRRSDRSDRDRDRDRPRRDRPAYEVEETIEARRGPARGGELVRRRRDSSESSVEEVERKFPPGGDYRRRKDYGPPRRAKSHGGGGRYDDDYDDKPRKKDKRRKSSSLFGCNLLTESRRSSPGLLFFLCFQLTQSSPKTRTSQVIVRTGASSPWNWRRCRGSGRKTRS